MSEPLPCSATPVDPGDAIAVKPKNPFASTTVQGLAVAVVARLIRVGVEKYFPGVIAAEAWVPIATEIVGWVVGGAMIVVGRWTASRELGFGPRKQVVVK